MSIPLDKIFRSLLSWGVDQQKRTVRRPLPKRELEICERLKRVRVMLGLSQDEAAAQIGISRERLASYEDGRVALRFEIALKFCRQFIISEQWLALGEDVLLERLAKVDHKTKEEVEWAPLEIRMCMSLATEPEFQQVKAGTLFSDAFDKTLERVYLLLRLNHGRPRYRVFAGDNPKILRHYLNCMVDFCLFQMDEKQTIKFFGALMEAGPKLAAKIRGESSKDCIMPVTWGGAG
jgi:DNA-binding XRE family transcriptional regulator